MKDNILILTTSIKSHIVPSFFIAELLSSIYNVYYYVDGKSNNDLVKINGFNVYVSNSSLDISDDYSNNINHSVSFMSKIADIISQKSFNKRKKALSFLCKDLKPKMIIIDIFSSYDYIILKGLNVCKNIIFFNPMPSTYRVFGYPTVSEPEFLDTYYTSNKLAYEKPKITIKKLFNQPKSLILAIVNYYCSIKILKQSGIYIDEIAQNNDYTLGFKNIPELLLLPLEFEFSEKVCASWQTYLGLSIFNNRSYINIDKSFYNTWSNICKFNNRIIYCSFGTYYSGANLILINFLERLLKAVEDIDNCVLIVSVNESVTKVFQPVASSLANVYFFNYVPQLEVLEKASLYVCHGGMGSIKESIRYSVPLLVYPLDLNYDQNGNGLKVEYHKLGLRGDFKYENVDNMRKKISELLDNYSYKAEMIKFKDKIKEKYCSEALLKKLNNFIK